MLFFGAAGVAWVVVAIVALTVDPLANPGAGYIGAGALGGASALTAVPLFWLVAFARQRRIAYRGDWSQAARRGAWVGVLIGVFVIMRLNGIFQLPIAMFLVVLAIAAEITLSAAGTGRR
jgi:uncharacterized protein YqgC (DUF456 family)